MKDAIAPLDRPAHHVPAQWFFRRTERLRFLLFHRRHARLTSEYKALEPEAIRLAEAMRELLLLRASSLNALDSRFLQKKILPDDFHRKRKSPLRGCSVSSRSHAAKNFIMSRKLRPHIIRIHQSKCGSFFHCSLRCRQVAAGCHARASLA
jgi:hypothetical protein